MKFKKYPSLVRAADALQKRGFEDQFTMENNRLKHEQSKREYDPSEVMIVEYHRFVPRNMLRDQVSIIFALETNDGVSGLLTSSYNAYGKVKLLEFMDRVKIKSKTENAV